MYLAKGHCNIFFSLPREKVSLANSVVHGLLEIIFWGRGGLRDMHLGLHLSNYYSHSNIKHGGSPIQTQRSFQENEKEVIVAGPAPKCHHREADSAEGG